MLVTGKTLLRAHGQEILSGGQPDENPSGGHRRALEAGTFLCPDVQRDVTLHPQHLWSLRLLSVSLLSLLQLCGVAKCFVDSDAHNIRYSLCVHQWTYENENLCDKRVSIWCDTLTWDNVKPFGNVEIWTCLVLSNVWQRGNLLHSSKL